MAKQPELHQAQLSKEEMERAIIKIDRRITEINDFDIESIAERSDPKIKALEVKLDALLMSIFDADTHEYNRYSRSVTRIDRAGYSTHGTPIEEVREGLKNGLGASKAQLEGIKSGFLEDLEDMGFSSGVAPETKQSLSSTLEGLHQEIQEKCLQTFEAGAFAEAVEKSFKIVRDKLRNLTGHETGSEAFGKGNLHIKGAAAANVEDDFNQAVKFLTMSIDMFRNEKSHTSDGQIDDPVRAHHYLTLSSLALNLLEGAEIRPKPKIDR